MSKALPGENLCAKHQGNHSHYAEHNCTICTLQKQLQLALKYKAEFLWPHLEGSVEQAGYEFANAKTPRYQEQWWEILKQRIRVEDKP